MVLTVNVKAPGVLNLARWHHRVLGSAPQELPHVVDLGLKAKSAFREVAIM
jgi:hypothetical protein